MADYDYDLEFEILRLEAMNAEAIAAAYSGNSWWALLSKKENFLRCVIASLPFAGQQFSGAPYLFGYTTYFFQQAGLKDPFLGNVIINLVYLFALIGSFFLIDKWGRRPLVLWGCVGLGVINIAIGGLGWLPTGSTTSGAVLITFSCLWILGYALSLGPTGEYGCGTCSAWLITLRLAWNCRSLLLETPSKNCSLCGARKLVPRARICEFQREIMSEEQSLTGYIELHHATPFIGPGCWLEFEDRALFRRPELPVCHSGFLPLPRDKGKIIRRD
jgi:hypothetical protein